MYFSFLMPNSKMTQGLRMAFLKARIKKVKKTRKDILSPPVIAARSRYIAVTFLFFAFIFKLNFNLIPHVSNPIPLICYFLIISLVAVCLAAMISVLMMRLDFISKRKEVPESLKTIVALILLRYWYPKEKERQDHELQGREPVPTPSEKRPFSSPKTTMGKSMQTTMDVIQTQLINCRKHRRGSRGGESILHGSKGGDHLPNGGHHSQFLLFHVVFCGVLDFHRSDYYNCVRWERFLKSLRFFFSFTQLFIVDNSLKINFHSY
jgi:hypothetical protein